MSSLSNAVNGYYESHFNELPFDKQFHFASRRYLWDQNEFAHQNLVGLRSNFTYQENPLAALQSVLSLAQASPAHGSKNASALREPYFLKYPKLKQYVTVLFRIAFLETIYNLPCRHLFSELFPASEVSATVTALQQDPAALAMLSTHAINFLYLYERIIVCDDTSLNPAQFLSIGSSQYDLSDVIHIQLLIYLYTHCIIGESKFYYRAVAGHRDIYTVMLADLEQLIATRFSDINLDNKFEFLVCCRMLQFPTELAARIYQEAEQSLAPNGSFLIDSRNNNPQTANVDIAGSEHRNILFILSERVYQPSATAR